MKPDVALARKWYEHARELGSSEASESLARLGERGRRSVLSGLIVLPSARALHGDS